MGYRTSLRIWTVASVVLFVALGFFDPWKGAAKGENDWWSLVSKLPTFNRTQLDEILPPLLLYTLVLGFAALVFGWVLQALIAIAGNRSTKSRVISDAPEVI
jgi:hypothetical protein